MALSIAATACKSPITIKNSDVVRKSYSRFYTDLDNVAQFS